MRLSVPLREARERLGGKSVIRGRQRKKGAYLFRKGIDRKGRAASINPGIQGRNRVRMCSKREDKKRHFITSH
jgi:hypothetical protein